jgi:hypothetical protein
VTASGQEERATVNRSTPPEIREEARAVCSRMIVGFCTASKSGRRFDAAAPGIWARADIRRTLIYDAGTDNLILILHRFLSSFRQIEV